MEIYNTEEQQVEAIKSWWRDNGMAVLIGAVVGFGSLYGWRYYRSEALENQEQSSQAYNQAISALASDPQSALIEAENFVEKNDDNYASLLSLQLAKSFVKNNELAKAAKQLRLVQQKNDEVLASLATIRLSRIEAELGNFDVALAELSKVDAKSWKAQTEALRGDIMSRQGDFNAAVTAYTASLAEQTNPAVQMKLDNISK